MTTRPLASSLLLVTAFAACGTSVAGGNPSSSSTGSATAGDGGAVATSTGDVTSTTTGTGGATTVATGAGSTTSTGTGGAAVADAQPPGHPTAPFGAPGTGSVTFAISKLYLGDTDRDGTVDLDSGWEQYGFDIDGKISTATSTDLCTPANGAPVHSVYPDGLGGIDNSFGAHILPLIVTTFASHFSQDVNSDITTGHRTLLLDLPLLGSGASYDPLAGRIYPVTPLGHVPLFDGTDVWPVDPAGLAVAGDLTSAKVQLPGGYLNGDTWVGHTAGSLSLTLSAGGLTLPLVIVGATITMTLDPTHSHATNGTISGVLDVSALKAAFKQAAGAFDPSLCTGPSIGTVYAETAQASDILQDGSQDPTKICDGISIGIGFDAERVQLGPIGPAQPPPSMPCP